MPLRNRILTAGAAIACALVLPAAAQAAIPVSFVAKDAPAEDNSIFKAGGLRLGANCDPGFGPAVYFNTSKDNAALHTGALESGAANNAPGTYAGFAPAPQIKTLFTGTGGDVQVTSDDSVGQLVYADPSGSVVTMDWLADSEGALGADCAFVGTARALDGGSHRIFFRADANSDTKKVLDLAGLEVEADCDGSGSLYVTADGATDSSIHWSNLSNYNEDAFDDEIFQSEDHMVSDGIVLSSFMDNAVGNIVYTNGKRVVSIDFFADSNGESLGRDCAFAGIATAAKKGTPAAAVYAKSGDQTEKTFFAKRPMKLRASCDIFQDIDVDVATKVKASVHAQSQSDFDANGGDEENYLAGDSLVPGAQLELFGTALQDVNGTGQIVYASRKGSYRSIDYLIDEEDALGKDCLFAGIVTSASS
jgi:hypothetical protein